ncbi:MAG: type II toxin-antitoxin system mRNA interferase toxin, RelE/StbE family [Gammaproteobacteria bacterium]|nr:MAG: type II toxin-antitoxin system mRNA interferase toxin, RelE/StbE family [Gammaproteobacteria bacterium]
MRTIKPSSQFKKDIKHVKKNPIRNKGIKILSEEIIPVLLNGNTLDRKFLDHSLTSEAPPKRDCHVLNDLVLLYYVTDEYLLLYRLGTHSELFG